MPHSRKGPIFAISFILFMMVILAVMNEIKIRKAIRFREESISANATLYYPYYRTQIGTINVDANEPWIAETLAQKLKEKNVEVSKMHIGTDSILVNH